MNEPGDAAQVAGLAAVVGRQTLDLNLYAGFLMNSLADVLGRDYIEVQRKGSLAGRLRGREAEVVRVSVSVGDERFTLLRESSVARPVAQISHIVSGIVLRSEPAPLDLWSRRLAEALQKLAQSDSSAAAALARITSLTI